MFVQTYALTRLKDLKLYTSRRGIKKYLKLISVKYLVFVSAKKGIACFSIICFGERKTLEAHDIARSHIFLISFFVA